ncbi:hypothetical protein N7454_001501 [Penicillium verhagenii]|nr:hypothetical protein N7454_001501 [Penicillium verhagenii]
MLSRRCKKRVIDLRHPKTTDDAMSVSDENAMTEYGPPFIASAPLPIQAILNEQSDDLVTPPFAPKYLENRFYKNELIFSYNFCGDKL